MKHAPAWTFTKLSTNKNIAEVRNKCGCMWGASKCKSTAFPLVVLTSQQQHQMIIENMRDHTNAHTSLAHLLKHVDNISNASITNDLIESNAGIANDLIEGITNDLIENFVFTFIPYMLSLNSTTSLCFRGCNACT